MAMAPIILSSADSLEKYRVRSDLDIWVIPKFAQEVLGFDPAKLQADLESNYPIVGKDEEIEPCKTQWVDGANKALNYRGNELKRSKMWLQKGRDSRVCQIFLYRVAETSVTNHL